MKILKQLIEAAERADWIIQHRVKPEDRAGLHLTEAVIVAKEYLFKISHYTEADVFLSQEDSSKILPYIKVPENWSWWYLGRGSLEKGAKIKYDEIPTCSLDKAKFYHFKVPAITSELLGKVLLYNEHCQWSRQDGAPIILKDGKSIRLFGNGETCELQNRRDAVMYMIEKGWIKKR